MKYTGNNRRVNFWWNKEFKTTSKYNALKLKYHSTMYVALIFTFLISFLGQFAFLLFRFQVAKYVSHSRNVCKPSELRMCFRSPVSTCFYKRVFMHRWIYIYLCTVYVEIFVKEEIKSERMARKEEKEKNDIVRNLGMLGVKVEAYGHTQP